MAYCVKGVAKPAYYGFMYGRESIESFDVNVDVDSPILARESARAWASIKYLKLAQIRDVYKVQNPENSISAPALDLSGMKKKWWETKIVAFDVETTGLDPQKNRIVEIAFSEMGDKEFQEPESYLLNEGREIPAESSEIHGITNDMIKGKPSFDDVFEEIYEKYIKDTTLMVAHNKGFDHQFLVSSMKRNNYMRYVPPCVCTMEMGIMNDMGQENNRLETLIELMGVDGINSHRAGDDCRGSGNLFLKFARRPGSVYNHKEATAMDIIQHLDDIRWPNENSNMGFGNNWA